MSWIDRVRKALPFQDKRDTPDNLWTSCPSCKEMLFTREYEDNLSVCPRCEHHGRIGADARFTQLMDDGFTILDSPKVKEDPLKFKDQKKYPDRLKAARATNPHPDALTNALGTIGGHKAVLGVQDFAFMGGSMGMAVGAAALTLILTVTGYVQTVAGTTVTQPASAVAGIAFGFSLVPALLTLVSLIFLAGYRLRRADIDQPEDA